MTDASATPNSRGAESDPAPEPPSRLDVLKALGDNTRYAIYLELARAPAPLATANIAESLDLHVNTVRPHLERMRDVGLLRVHTASTGGVGRPQHRYSLSADAPALGLEPPLFPLIARMLLEVAADVGANAADAVDAGNRQGSEAARAYRPADTALALLTELDKLGFDPELAVEDQTVTIGFANCPFADLAQSNPDLVCGLHRGMVEGFVEELGACEVQEFHTLVDRTPCQVDLLVETESSLTA